MTTLLDLVETLARDPGAKSAYHAAPDSYLAEHGFGELSPADVNEAVLHSALALPPQVSSQFRPDDGLASVVESDPSSFDQSASGDYEDDLYGLEEDSPIFQDATLEELSPAAPFGDESTQHDPAGVDQTAATEHGGAAPGHDTGTTDGPEHTQGAAFEAAEHPDAMHHLSESADPHALDDAGGFDAPAPAPAPAGPDTTPPLPLQPAEEVLEPSDLAQAPSDAFELQGDDSPEGPQGSELTDTGFLTDTVLFESQPFDSFGPSEAAGSDPTLMDADSGPLGVEPIEPEEDLLDDAGDIDPS